VLNLVMLITTVMFVLLLSLLIVGMLELLQSNALIVMINRHLHILIQNMCLEH
jgi:hypothetical protein